MSQTIQTKRDRDLTDEELNAVTGGKVIPPTNINKPVFKPLLLTPQA